MYGTLFLNEPLEQSTASPKTYSGEPLRVVGQREVEVKANGQKAKLLLLVVAGDGPSLFGRDWLRVIRLNWRAICQVRKPQLSEILDRHESVFQPGLGTLKGYEAKIFVEPEARTRFCKAHSVPYRMREKVEKEWERLQQEGIIEPIQFADWAAPIVPVLKSDGKSVRIRGDIRVTVKDRYPIPKIEDLFARLAGGKMFMKLDMSQAYQQIVVEEESRKLVVISTQQGLFQYNHLPYGVSSAPGIFQRVMESLLSGVPGVVVYIDDILVTGKTEEEHLAAIDEVLRRLSEAGLRLQQSKCVLMAPSVDYLGHRIDAQASTPRSMTELKSYLGLLSYYSRFLPNLSTLLAPLYKLLQHNQPWRWTATQEKAFAESKKLLTSSQVLTHFDPSLEIVLACDASAYGIGAVLSHRMPDGTEKPVGFVSRTLSDAERKYPQIKREALACVFGVSRFHSYLFGHHFQLQTDHKALITLFSEQKRHWAVKG